MAKLAELSTLKEEVPQYVVIYVIKMTRDNMIDSWKRSLNKEPDQQVLDALKEK